MRKWLKDLRSEKRMSMKEVASKLGISESYYCAIENGERQKRMDITLVSSLASIFGVTIATIAQFEAELAEQVSA